MVYTAKTLKPFIPAVNGPAAMMVLIRMGADPRHTAGDTIMRAPYIAEYLRVETSPEHIDSLKAFMNPYTGERFTASELSEKYQDYDSYSEFDGSDGYDTPFRTYNEEQQDFVIRSAETVKQIREAEAKQDEAREAIAELAMTGRAWL